MAERSALAGAARRPGRQGTQRRGAGLESRRRHLLRLYDAGRHCRNLWRARTDGRLSNRRMSATRVFCADLAIAQDEPLAGIGAMAERHLFMLWPKGKWRRPRYQSADMDDVLQQAIHQAYGP